MMQLHSSPERASALQPSGEIVSGDMSSCQIHPLARNVNAETIGRLRRCQPITVATANFYYHGVSRDVTAPPG